MIIIWIPYVTFLILQDAARHIARMETKQKTLATPITAGFTSVFLIEMCQRSMIADTSHCRHLYSMLE